MKMEEKMAIISDAHIKYNETERINFFSDLILSLNYDKIILLGDIFDFWVGYSRFLERRYEKIISAMLKKMENSDIIFVEGNHDFFIKNFDFLGIKSFKEYIYKNFFFSHGDTYTNEIHHKIFRKIIDKFKTVLSEKKNGDKIIPIGIFLSNLSRKKNGYGKKRREIFSSMLENAKIKLKDFDAVIFGHCHIPAIISINGKFFVNSGFIGENLGTIAVFDKEFKLLKLK